MEKIIKSKLDCTLMNPAEIIDAIMKERGIEEDYAEFLNPALEITDDWYDIPLLKESAEEVLKLMNDKESRFFVNIDSDTDGVTSGAILVRWLKHHGINPDWHVNKGKSHGTTDEMIADVLLHKSNVVFILDSLDGDLNNYRFLASQNIHTYVLDHHDIVPEIHSNMPVPLISSNRSYNKELSGAGVTWLFVNYLESLLPDEENDGYSYELLDLAATGMIADMMDMSVVQNRQIANYGLTHLNNPAIKKVKGSFPFNAKSVSFSVAPLVNAACRMSRNEDAVKFILSDNKAHTLLYYNILQECKKNQNEEVFALMDKLEMQIDVQKNSPIYILKARTEYGICGLLANKFSAKYNRPVIVINESSQGSGGSSMKGSARSIGCEDFRELCNQTGLCKAAGHPEAFGFEVSESNLEEFRHKIEARLEQKSAVVEVIADAEIGLEDITPELAMMTQNVDFISGTGFPSIKYKIVIDDYEWATMSNDKHLVIEPTGFDEIQIVSWNNGNLLQHYELYDGPLVLVGSLEYCIFAKKRYCRFVVEDIVTDE